jgi:translocation and assembly module TamB
MGRLALWLPGAALGLLLAGAVALWLWAATTGSLAQTLAWTGQWLKGQEDSLGSLRTEQVEGSLRGGGRIGLVHWRRGDLSVQAEGVALVWSDALWTDLLAGRGLHLRMLQIRQLTVDDRRAPEPSEPLSSLALPLPISLTFEVQRTDLTGRRTLSASDIRGHYRYAALSAPGDATDDAPALPDTPDVRDSHRLRIDELRWAEGSYRARLNLGAQAPLPLSLEVQGEVTGGVPESRPIRLQARASVSGTLAGTAATLDLNAQARPADAADEPEAPALSLSARLLPWAEQPLHSADVNARSLNLATLWPGAPLTALSGRLQAQPDGDAWHATVQIDNALERPADQQGLPLTQLQAEVTQLGKRWTVTALRARLGGGTLQGQASFSLDTGGQEGSLPTDWQGDVQALELQPSRLWSTLAPGALDGRMSARAAQARANPDIDLKAQWKASARQPAGTALIGTQGLTGLDLQGQWLPAPPAAGSPGHGGVLVLDALRLNAAGLTLQGEVRVDTAARHLKGRLGLDLPGARLDWDGLAAHSSGQGDLRLRLDDASRTLGWVQGLGELPWWPAATRAALQALGQARADGSGLAVVEWSGGLAVLGWPSPGDAPGAAATPVAAPRLRATLNLPRFSWQADPQAQRLAFSRVALQAAGPLSALAVTAAGSASAAGWSVAMESDGQLALNNGDPGRLDLSRLQLRIGPETASLRQPGWQLLNTTPLSAVWRTDPSAGLTLDGGSGGLALRPLPRTEAATTAAPTTLLSLDWQRLLWQAGSLETQGRLLGLTLPWLDALAALSQDTPPLAANGISGDLVFDGDWNLRLPASAGDPLSLKAQLQRRSGDIRWAGASGAAGATLAAGVRDARLRLGVQDRQLQALLRWDSERLGQASADLSSALGTGVGSGGDALDRWWPASAPLRGTAQVRLPQVGVWSLLAPPGWRMQGTLNADATLAGTRGKPDWSGTLQADELALRSTVDGIAFTQGQLRATLAGERIRVDRFSLQGPGGAASGGTLEASGLAEWRRVPGSLLRQPFIELQTQAQRLRVSSRPDRRLTLSGTVNATLNGNQLLLRGQLKADSALFILPDENTPSLGSDVVVRSTRDLPAPAANGQRVQPDVSVTLDLGPQFEVRGQGLQTRLEGQLSVRATPALPTPRVLGEVRTVSGTYRAYDQKLNIESGVLRFTGPYDDPALDIRAVRLLPEKVDQRVGVLISGNAQAPRVALFADPDLPDGDKLAWLVLGRPASAAGAQAFVLQQAARRLLSRGGEPLDGALARSLGIDEIGFSGSVPGADGTTTGAAVTLGKRLSNDLYLSYEQSLTGAMSTVSILYDLSRRLTLRARAGTENAIDLIFTQRYD